MKYIVLIGRILFAFLFIESGFTHFQNQTIEHAANHGVMMANLLVPASGFIAIVGGLSILLGIKTKWGAWLLVLFLVPVTLIMHNFWVINDTKELEVQMIMFMKNLSILGGALIIAYFGAGPLSIDYKKEIQKSV
jgi:putative oxidoreductase